MLYAFFVVKFIKLVLAGVRSRFSGLDAFSTKRGLEKAAEVLAQDQFLVGDADIGAEYFPDAIGTK